MMAEEGKPDCSCVIDTHGLHAMATASANLRPILIAALADGTVGVPSWAWKEFKKLYEDEATEVERHIVRRIQFNQRISVRAAQITEDLHLGFSQGAYDEHVERFTAAVALNKSYIVLTSADNVRSYAGMKCKVMELADWANEQ